MTPDWSLLAPHRPVDSGGDQYVPPPSNVGDAVARWVRASGAPVLLGGPTGVGKSTELAQIAAQLQGERAVCLIQLDRFENMRRLEVEGVLSRVAKIIEQTTVAKYTLKDIADVKLENWIISGLGKHPTDIALSAVRALARLAGCRVALLIDGLEKVPDGAQARALFDALSPLAEEADLVAVAPWNLAFGPQANEPLVRQGERFFFVRAPEVEPVETAPGVPFLLRLMQRRLKIAEMSETPESFYMVARDAAVMSGGLPRVFLQFLADCATWRADEQRRRVARNAQTLTTPSPTIETGCGVGSCHKTSSSS
ncbi:MAG: hypothetical protein IPO67_30745 [Deltaproteobacteria bacterium]|nr:hypothetical protein [Deltaproteobacteria bacterium]